MPVQASPELNGTFLPPYGSAGEPNAGVLLRPIAKSSSVGHEFLLHELRKEETTDVPRTRKRLILDESNLLPFDFLRTGDRLRVAPW